MNEFDRLAAKPPAVATKAELLQRLAERARPSPEHILTPGDEAAAEINTARIQSNEERIARLRGALDNSGKKFSHDQAQARLQGHSKIAFERTR